MRHLEGFVAAFVREQGIAADDAARILILLEELLTNLLKYGYPDRAEPGWAEIALALNGSRLEIEFIDDGCAFDPSAGPIAEPRRAARRKTGRRTRPSPVALADRSGPLRAPQQQKCDSTVTQRRIHQDSLTV